MACVQAQARSPTPSVVTAGLVMTGMLIALGSGLVGVLGLTPHKIQNTAIPQLCSVSVN